MKKKQLLLMVICSLIVPVAIGCSNNGSSNLSKAKAEGRDVVRGIDSCQEIEDLTAQANCLEQVQNEYIENSLR